MRIPLFKTPEALLEGYKLNQRSKGQKVYLRARILSNGRLSLYYYGIIGGKVVRQTANLFLDIETDYKVKEKNKATKDKAEILVNDKNKEVKLTGNCVSMATSVKSKATFAVMLEAYISSRELSYSRKCTYNGLLSHAEKAGLAKMQLKDITPETIREFVAYLKNQATNIKAGEKRGLHVNTQSSYLQALNVVLNYAVRLGAILVNPTERLERYEKPARHNAEREYLTLEEVRILYATPCANEMVKTAFLFSCFTGLRFSDICRIKRSNIKKNDIGTYVSMVMQKTNKEIKVYLSDVAKKFLPMPTQAEANIFTLPTPTGTNADVDRWAKKAGITKHVTFHTARHTAATIMLNLGTDITTVQNILGHSDVRVTEIYAKLLDRTQANAMQLQNNITL